MELFRSDHGPENLSKITLFMLKSNSVLSHLSKGKLRFGNWATASLQLPKC